MDVSGIWLHHNPVFGWSSPIFTDLWLGLLTPCTWSFMTSISQRVLRLFCLADAKQMNQLLRREPSTVTEPVMPKGGGLWSSASAPGLSGSAWIISNQILCVFLFFKQHLLPQPPDVGRWRVSQGMGMSTKQTWDFKTIHEAENSGLDQPSVWRCKDRTLGVYHGLPSKYAISPSISPFRWLKQHSFFEVNEWWIPLAKGHRVLRVGIAPQRSISLNLLGGCAKFSPDSNQKLGFSECQR